LVGEVLNLIIDCLILKGVSIIRNQFKHRKRWPYSHRYYITPFQGWL